MSVSPGTLLGPYEVLAAIGAGGMGDVYKARDPRAVAALNHPNICTLYDVGPNYLVFEYIEGATLKGLLPLEKSLEYAGQILDALDHAHRDKVTHRDLKPANIMVTKKGVKLLDFGLARIEDAPADATLTIPGSVMGTPAYMSPEQWQGKPGDARSDIYAFGCVLYEMLTGKRATENRGAVEPVAVDGAVRGCLEPDLEERWQSAADLRRALALQPGVAAPLRSPWRERLWIALAAAFVAVALLLWLRPAPASSTGEVVKLAIYPPEGGTFSPDPQATASVPGFALSPDGRAIVMVAPAPLGKSMLWLRSMDEVAARPLAGTEDARSPFWSPDSRWIVFFSEGKLRKILAAGGTPQVVADGFADGPDGTILASTGTGGIVRVSFAGGPASAVTEIDTAKGQGVHRYPQFLPDRSHFLFFLVGDQRGVYAGSLDGRTKKLLVRGDAPGVYASPGYLLFRYGDALLGQAFDPSSLELSGDRFLVAGGVGRSSASDLAVSFSNVGTLAYASVLSQASRLAWFDRSGKQLGPVGPLGNFTDFRLSPDEKQLAVSLVDVKAGNLGIWLADLARGGLSPFAPAADFYASPLWSPDGRSLVYRSVNEFSRRSAGGGGPEEMLLSRTVEAGAGISSPASLPVDVSPDRKNLVFTVPSTASSQDVWVLPLEGERKPLRFLDGPGDERHPNFSPDGRMVAYGSNESGRCEIHVVTFPSKDRKWQISTSGGYEPRWRADGREIYYLSEDRKLMVVSVADGPAFGVPRALFQTGVPEGNAALRTHYVPSHDGQRFLINTRTGDTAPAPITVVLNWTAGLKK